MKKNGFVPLIITLIIAILGVVGYFLYKNYYTKLQVLVVPSPASLTTSGSTANWKTYINKTKGYSLNYPDDWFVSADDSDQTTLANFPTDNPNKDKENLIMYVGKYDETIQNGVDLAIWLKENNHWSSDFYGEPTKSLQTTVAGNPGMILSYSGSSPFYVFIAQSHVFWAYQAPQSPDFSQIFNQILSTFKFTR